LLNAVFIGLTGDAADASFFAGAVDFCRWLTHAFPIAASR
jgi:hypothetical protein